MSNTEEENSYKFAHKDMLTAGLEWLKDTATYLTLNTNVPESGDMAISTMLAGMEIDKDQFVGPDYINPAEATADDNPLGKGDVILYLNNAVMLGLSAGTVKVLCLLRGLSNNREIIYMSSAVDTVVYQDYPVFLGHWCICSSQPTDICQISPNLTWA